MEDGQSAIDREMGELARRTRVFVSYSRVDWAFADWLVARLCAHGYDASLDRRDIRPGEDWRKRLAGKICGADTVLFILSPDTLASDACVWEAQEAARLGKHAVPIAFRRLNIADAPGELAKLHVIDALEYGAAYERVVDAARRAQVEALSPAARTRAEAERDEMGASYIEILGAAQPELERLVLEALTAPEALWVREQTNWTQRADAWVQAENEEKPSKLLRMGEVAEARLWMNRRSAAAPEIPEIIQSFVAASEAKEADDQNRLHRAVQRGFVEPVKRAMEAGNHAKALRLMAAGAILSKDIQLKMERETPEPHRDALLRAGEEALKQMSFAADEERTSAFGASRSEIVARDVVLALAAALSFGEGRQADGYETELLMLAAPDDLLAAIKEGLTEQQHAMLPQTIEQLRASAPEATTPLEESGEVDVVEPTGDAQGDDGQTARSALAEPSRPLAPRTRERLAGAGRAAKPVMIAPPKARSRRRIGRPRPAVAAAPLQETSAPATRSVEFKPAALQPPKSGPRPQALKRAPVKPGLIGRLLKSKDEEE